MLLQLALDFGKLDDLIGLAHHVVAWVDWIEVGTPLIKQYGIQAVTRVKNDFPNHVIVADMKTADAGGLEVEMAVNAGAGVVTVLAAASDATVRETLTRANQRGSKVVVDLIGQPDPIARAMQLAEFKPHYFNLHRSTDAFASGVQLQIDLIRKFAKSVPIPLSVAGGINLDNVKDLRAAGVAVVVVGGAITSAPDPSEAARKFKSLLS